MSRPDFSIYGINKIKIICPQCETLFYRYPADIKNRQTVTCSVSCSHKYNQKKKSKLVTKEQIIIDFWSKVNKTHGLGPWGDCWEWTYEKNKYGYGQLWFYEKKQRILAHRFSYELCNGEFDTSLFVCHSCDNPPCVNPDHLFLGTNEDNMKDKIKKGRQSKKLTKEQVYQIKFNSNNITNKELSKQYNVSDSMISEIKNNKLWRSIIK